MAARRLQTVLFLPHTFVRAKGTVVVDTKKAELPQHPTFEIPQHGVHRILCTPCWGISKVGCWGSSAFLVSTTTVPLARTKVCGKNNTVWSRRAAILDPKFNEEHDARISFGHRARVQQPARAGGRLPGRLLGRHPARAHASNEIPRAHPSDLRIQIMHVS